MVYNLTADFILLGGKQGEGGTTGSCPDVSCCRCILEVKGDAPATAMLDDDDDNSDSSNTKNIVDKEVMIQAYAQALAELVERFKLDIVQLVLVGPDCPDCNLELSCSIPSSSSNNSSAKKSKSSKNRDDLSRDGPTITVVSLQIMMIMMLSQLDKLY